MNSSNDGVRIRQNSKKMGIPDPEPELARPAYESRQENEESQATKQSLGQDRDSHSPNQDQSEQPVFEPEEESPSSSQAKPRKDVSSREDNLTNGSRPQAHEAAGKFEQYGVPIQESLEAQSLPEQEHLLPELEAELNEQAYLEEKWKFSHLLTPGIKTALAGISALILLLLTAEAWSLFNQILQLPFWARYPALACMALLLGIVLYCMLKTARAYFKLKKSPRLSMSALIELHNREHLRNQAMESWFQAQGELLDFLRDYPLEDEKAVKQLLRTGFTQQDLQMLNKNQKALLEAVQESSAQEWIARLDQEFIQFLDQAAKKRIGRYAKFVGLKTAIAPTGFVDTAIVLYHSHRLIGDLCRIYRLRAGNLETASIMLRVFVNTFVAGQLEDMLEGLVHQLTQEFGDGNHFISFISRAHLGGVFTRAAEGSTNAMLILRLGASTICHLRPIRTG